MRALAVVGLVAILALAAWLIVVGVRLLPKTGDGLGAAVTTITSIFSREEASEIKFSLPSTTFVSGDPATIAWNNTAPQNTEDVMLSYACVPGVSFSIFADAGWSDTACDTPVSLAGSSVTVIPSATIARFNDVQLTLTSGTQSDTRVVTVINSKIASALPEEVDTPVETPVETPAKPVVTPTPTPVQPTPTPVVLPPVVVSTPADLSVSIISTGVLTKVSGRDTFFALDTIPSDKTAAVKFLVKNEGTIASGPWTFVATLPTEGDEDYRYVSPVQQSLRSTDSIEFTLGFDDVLQEDSGVIRITLRPTNSNDPVGNNTAAVEIGID